MIYAQVLDSFIANIVVIDDVNLLPIFLQNYDALIEIDQLTPQPQIGWYYDIPTNAFYPFVTIALIQNNVIVNIIENYANYVSENPNNYQFVVDITLLYPQPQIGYTYINGIFAAPLSVGGYNIYYVSANSIVGVPHGSENICTKILTIDGILQIAGKVTIL